MAGWEVVSQEPAAQQFEDRWAVVEETAQQDPWKPVSQAPLRAEPVQAAIAPQTAPAASSEPTFLQKVHEKIDPEPIIGGVVASGGRMLSSLLGLPQRAIEGSQQDVATLGSGEPKASVEPAAEAALATMPLRKTVGGVRAHPTDAVAAKPVEPSVTAPSQKADPLAPPEPVKAPEPVAESVSGPDPLAHPEPSPQQLTGARKAARVIQNILNPDEVSPMAQSAAADIRQAGGKAARDTETTRAVLDAESQKVSRLPDEEKLRLIDYIETRSQGETVSKATFKAGEGGVQEWTLPEAVDGFGVQGKFVVREVPAIETQQGVSPHAGKYIVLRSGEHGRSGQLTESGVWIDRPQKPAVFNTAAEAEAAARANISKDGMVTTGPSIREDLVPVADAVKKSMDLRRNKIEALDSAEKAQFVQDYYTHLWKDPEAAAQAFGGPAKEGSGRFLKERSIPTVAEGIARGLEPVSLNPLEVTMRYAQAMDRFIATKQVLDKGLKEGTLKHYTPGEQPPGWVEVNTRKAGGPVYAPADWARVYNNFVDRGIHGWNEDLGMVYDAARKASNSVTALELGLSGFHMATMAQEAVVNGVAKGIHQIASGMPIKGAKSLAESLHPAAIITKPIKDVIKGRELEHVYLGKTQGTPLMREITDLLTEAGGRAKGMKHAPEYEYSAGGSYWDSFKHGLIQMELRAADAEYAGKGLAGTGGVAVKQTFRQVGRILQTVAKPLFEYAIPKLKNGAFYENMHAWMEANPGAPHAAALKEARKIWNSIDNRFGETVQDNIFWNKTLKQALQLDLRSYSWTFGTIQEIGGGAVAARKPSSLSMKSKNFNPKAAYIIALPIVYGTLGAYYQFLKTGKMPESPEDLVRGGKTGGIAPGVGGKGEVPERVMMPGYMKDVFGWIGHPMQEIKNKQATLPRMVGETFANEDWRGKPIRNENAPTPDQLRQYFEYVYRTLGPISLRQMAKGQKTGSNITTGEALLGLRPAPAQLQDPEGYDRMKKGIAQRNWKSKERADKKQERQYGGPQ